MEQKLRAKEYDEALRQNKILGLKCKDCGTITVPPKMVCEKCTSTNMDVIELKGGGKIQTFTTVYVPAGGREAEAPYITVIVELDEGPWIMGNLDGVDPEKASMDLIDRKVKMGYKICPDDIYSDGDTAGPLFTIVS